MWALSYPSKSGTSISTFAFPFSSVWSIPVKRETTLVVLDFNPCKWDEAILASPPVLVSAKIPLEFNIIFP